MTISFLTGRKKITFAILALILSSVSPLAFARQATDEEAGIKILNRKVEIDCEINGLCHLTYMSESKILRDKAMDNYSTYSIGYDANQDTIDSLDAWVIAPNGTKTLVDPANIVDKSLASNKPGYDEQRTRYFPWPNLSVGAILHVEYKKTLKPEIEGVISARWELLSNYSVDNMELVLKLPNTTTFKLTDQKGFFTQTTTKSNGKTTYTFTGQNLPNLLYKEENYAALPEFLNSFVDYTSTKSWAEAADAKAKGYNKVLAQPLPKELEALFGPKPDHVLSNAEAQTRLNTIINQLISKIRYFGDWRRIDGGYVPRDLSEIVRTGYADCKDYSALVVSAARYLGLQADPAVINRGYQIEVAPTLPMPFGWTNHAIAKIIAPDGKTVWWTDATNARSPLGLIPADIAGRPALVLSANGHLESLPEIDANENHIRVDWTFDLSQSPNLKQQVQSHKSGFSAWTSYKQMYDLPPEGIESKLIDDVGVSGADATHFHLQDFKFSTEAPFQWSADFSFEERNAVERSGPYKILYVVGSSYVSAILETNPETRFMDLDLYMPTTYTTRQILPKIGYDTIVAEPDTCDLQSQWVDFKRNVNKAENEDFVITSTTVIKARRLPINDLKSPEFVHFQKQLSDCVRNVRVLMR